MAPERIQDEDAADFDVIVARKPMPEPRSPFVCVICERETEHDPWRRPPHWEPICRGCESHWSDFKSRRVGFTRDDQRFMQRLSAVRNAPLWEVNNGRRRSERPA